MKNLDEAKRFRNFLDQEADKTTEFANIDEMIQFAFGEIEAAIEQFERERGTHYEDNKKYLEDEYFLGFVSDEFDSVQAYATDEELAEWGLGSLDEALERFEELGDGD